MWRGVLLQITKEFNMGILNKGFAIAIDGPSGVGKSTVAKLLAKQLNITYIDTGAMYRAVALYNIRNNSSHAVEKSLEKINIELSIQNSEQRIFLNGEDVTTLIRTQEVSDATSRVVAVNETVRKKLVELQQQMAKKNAVVMDGRDIGSQVLPNAQVKIYLDAAPEIRAKRRALEMQGKGQPHDFVQILQEIHERDERDKNRLISPLVQTPDAIYLDTVDLTPAEVAQKIADIVKERV